MTLGVDPDNRIVGPGITVHFLVKDPPLDRMAALVQYLAPHVDEFVIVDTSESPHYAGIMQNWSAPTRTPVIVIRTDFVDFATTRNVGHEQHHYEWTLGLDPDELPTWKMLEFIKFATSEEGKDQNPEANGYVFWTYNWWEGELGPEANYHWHTRLYRTVGSWVERPIHELVVVCGTPELSIRNTSTLPLAPREAYLIHSKGMDDIQRADALYAKMGEVSR
jgi:hypothetical protein